MSFDSLEVFTSLMLLAPAASPRNQSNGIELKISSMSHVVA